MGIDWSVENGRKPALVLMASLPGTSRSTPARAIGETFGWPVIDKDVSVTSLLDSRIEEPVAQPASYAVMFALGRDVLGTQWRSVILDSPSGLPVSTSQAQRVADATDAFLICILFVADRTTRHSRPVSVIAPQRGRGDDRVSPL